MKEYRPNHCYACGAITTVFKIEYENEISGFKMLCEECIRVIELQNGVILKETR